MNRPTHVAIHNYSDDTESLVIEIDQYSKGIGKNNYSRWLVLFDKAVVPEYISMIDKYIEWEGLAKSRGDIFTKKIGTVKSTTLAGTYTTMEFDFHSGNASNHYLCVYRSTPQMGLDKKVQALYFDRDNSIILKDLLKKYETSRLGNSNIDQVYQ